VDLKLYAILLENMYFVWEPNLMDEPTHEIHKIKCATNINDFTVVNFKGAMATQTNDTKKTHFKCEPIL